MNNNKNFFFVFIASFMVGMLISMNFDFARITSYSVLDSSEYAQAVEKRNTLYKEWSELSIFTVSEEIADAWNQIAEILIQKFAKIEG